MPAGIRRTGLVAATAAARAGRPLLASRTREDPFFSRVTLLCPFNGADNGTTFTDIGPGALAITRAGATPPVTKTDQSVFAGSSAYFGGAGYLTLPSDSDAFAFLGEDFTVEAWIRPASVSAAVRSIVALWPTEAGAGWRFLQENAGLTFSWRSPAGVTSSFQLTSGLLVANQWSHVAVTRRGSTLGLFSDGSRRTTTTISTKIRTATSALNIGRQEESNVWYYTGHMAELRITKGVARYTGSTYQLPAFPHPVR